MVTPPLFWHTVPSPHNTECIPNLRLPSTLWHVQHYDSRSISLTSGGFQARNPLLDIRSCEALKAEAATHFVWNTREWDSCFLSTFDNQQHAERWAKMKYKKPPYNSILKQPVMIYELDTSKLPPGTKILQATALCKALDIDHPYKEHEWIFHQQIPACCIVRRYYPWSDYERSFQAPRKSCCAAADICSLL